MPIELYREGTEWVWIPLTEVRGDVQAIESVELFFAASPSTRPAPEDWVSAEVVTSTTPDLGEGLTKPHIAILVGPDAGDGGVDLTPQGPGPADYQLWSKVETASEVVVRKRGVVTIL